MLTRNTSLELHQANNLPELQEFLFKRAKPNAYFIFYDKFLPCVVGKNYWKKTVPGKLVTEIATASDEALTLLIMENSWDCWKQEATVKQGLNMEGVKKVKTRWTSNAMSAGKYEGWGSDGIPRYNTLCSEVKDDRKENSVFFDNEYQRKKQEEILRHSSAYKPKSTTPVVKSYNDLEDVGINFVEI
jgi:hypothetical protein